jgi:hypothetical protein
MTHADADAFFLVDPVRTADLLRASADPDRRTAQFDIEPGAYGAPDDRVGTGFAAG